MQISFGSKIPISACKIYNKEAKKFERATLYEIDCKDEEDINYLNNIEGKWEYKDSVAYGAKYKYMALLGVDFEETMPCMQDWQFYSLETEDRNTACICEVHPMENSKNIEIIESNPDKKYKYAGQTLLAGIAKRILPYGFDLEVLIPVKKAESFYSKVCGFPRNDSTFGYCVKNQGLKDFIERVEEKVQGNILNINV